MTQRLFRRLVSIEEAKLILKRNFYPKPLGAEHVPLSEAHSRTLAENVVAPIDVPPFNRSTVDGYAVKASDTFGAEEDRPIALRIRGHVSVGESPSITVKSGETAEIATGAPMPKGADAVVMLEYATRKGEKVLVSRSVSMGENVMDAGSDIRKGTTVLKEGKILSSREIGVLAALGLTEVNVYKRPRVAVISTGPEIVKPGEALPPGKVYDINMFTLSAAVRECGGEPIGLGIFPDDKMQLKVAIEKALKSADVIITSGGVSVGPKDVIPQVLSELGEPGVIVCGMAAKPGKPTTIAVINGKPVFSLPGHPTSALFMFHLLVRTVICLMAGKSMEAPLAVRAVAEARMFAARGRRTFIMVNLNRSKSGRWLASPVPLGLSGAITTLAKADGFIEIPESRQFVDVGEEVEVHLFKPKISG